MVSDLQDLFFPEVALSVAGLTSYIQELLEQDDNLRQVWVTGEVSSATRYRSGLFFTLQDPDAKAAINCVVWSSQLSRLATLPEIGEQIIILGRIHLHPQRGSYQLNVWQSLPAGEGLRALRYRQLRRRLEAEGLFDAERKRSLPAFPKIIAVVTSPQAAAWGDIQRTLKRRSPGLHILFSPALVQGEQAPALIVKAIQRVIEDGRAEVLIVSRGGGAVEDMACFNDEHVVRAVAECPIPVISGIGHQRDESLADLAADVCAHTPTAAAEQAVPQLSQLYDDHQERMAALMDAMRDRFSTTQRTLTQLGERVQRLRLDRQVERERQKIAWLRQRLTQRTEQQLHQAMQQCEFLQQRLSTLDPAAVLRRGYALVRQADGAVVRSSATLHPGQTLTVYLAQGQATVAVTHVDSSTAPSAE